MLYTLAAAAKASGLGASAIRAAIERGQITATRDLFDEWQVEENELHRLYFPIGEPGPRRTECPGGASSLASLEADTGVPVKQDGGAPRVAHENAAAGSIAEPDRDEKTQAAHIEPSEGAASSTAAAENEAAEPEGAPFKSQQWLALFESPKETDRDPDYDGRLRVSPLDNTDPTATGKLFWESEIRIDNRDNLLRSAMRPLADRSRTLLLAGALLTGLGLGWTGGWGSYHFFGPSTVADGKRGYSAVRSDPRIAAAEKEKERREAASDVSITGKIPARPLAGNKVNRRYASYHSVAQGAGLSTNKPTLMGRQNSTEAASENAAELPPGGLPQGTNELLRRAPVAETKPTTIEGWTVRSVYNGTAVLEGPAGVWTAARGDTIPGLGRVDSIVLWGRRWIVATSRGLVTTP